MKRSSIWRVLLILKLGLILFAFLVGLRSFLSPNYSKYGGFLAGIFLAFGPEILFRIFRAHITPRIELLYYLFVFVALDLGICLDYYKTLPYFDKVVHLCSGIFSALIGHYALQYWHVQSAPKHFKALFIISFSLAIAVLWECFEFACDKLLGQSMQQLISVGVDDTMWDLIMALIGSLIGGFALTSPEFVAYLDWMEPNFRSKRSKKVN